MIPCACLGAEQALGQDRSVYGPTEPAPARITPAPPTGTQPRLPIIAELERSAPVTMLEAWSLGKGAQVGLGRFRVAEPARRRTNMERERTPLEFEQRTRAIAGAGVNLRFR